VRGFSTQGGIRTLDKTFDGKLEPAAALLQIGPLPDSFNFFLVYQGRLSSVLAT
jgi:hypothetical protein